MKTLVCQSPGQFEYRDQEIPTIANDHALIRIRRIGICGTDLHAFEGTQPYFNYPRVLGHELSGEIVDIRGAGSNLFTEGELVCVLPYFSCGSCVACRTGKTNCCVHMQVAGVHCDGGMAEYFAVPTSMLIEGRGLDADALALVEPFSIGLHAIQRSTIRAGEFVLVIGAGPIGIGVMLFAKLAGAHVIAMDVNHHRLQLATKIAGLSHAIHVTNSIDAIQSIRDITGTDLPTLLIDATGNQQAINNGLQYVAHGGRYVLVGLQKGDLIFNHPDFHRKEMSLMSSRNATRRDFESVIQCMIKGEIDLPTYITHRIGFDQLKMDFPSLLDPQNVVLKALVEF